jgi:hypothetical protein
MDEILAGIPFEKKIIIKRIVESFMRQHKGGSSKKVNKGLTSNLISTHVQVHNLVEFPYEVEKKVLSYLFIYASRK